ncbi:MAG: 23S rRNA (uracil(1939)-C(5))-methyltransferase RlmD [Terracidiphilus sp.]
MKRRKPPATTPSAHTPAPPLPVTIEKPVYGGAFLARQEGKAIFAPLTLPGEQARVRIVDDRRGYAFAEGEEIVSAAPERVAPLCAHFGPCGGCHYQHANYAAQIDFKQAILRETLERAGVQPPAEIAVVAGEPWAYRNRIRLAFDSAGNPGYRGRRSHAVIPIRGCPIAAPVLVKAALAAAEYFRRYRPSQRPAEISLFCDATESALLATVVSANPTKAGAEDFALALREQVPALTGVGFVSQGLPGRQPRTVARWGADSLPYRAAGFDYRVDHGAFFQVNRWLVDALANRVTGGRSGKLAWDIFAGVGLFARRLESSFERVVAVESAFAAIPALESNLCGTAAAAIRASALEFLQSKHKEERPDLIVVDPPRAGLGAEITAQLAEVAATALVYVSCDPATLARDLHGLLAAGYALQSLTLADLFPQTFHIESVVELRRA